jgi:hypothetical protein
MPKSLAYRLKNLNPLGGYLWANSVARKHGDIESHLDLLASLFVSTSILFLG